MHGEISSFIQYFTFVQREDLYINHDPQEYIEKEKSGTHKGLICVSCVSY